MQDAQLSLTILWPAFFNHNVPETNPPPGYRMFGEFVTAVQATTIRGCMGWWSDNYTAVDAPTIGRHFGESLMTALYTDPRSRSFHNTDFYSDPSATLHFQILLLPLRKIRSTFSNKTQGLLLTETNGGTRRATFLPDVFPDSPLSEIVPLLVQKAGAPTAYDLYSYKTVGLKWPVTDTFSRAHAFLKGLTHEIADAMDRLLSANRRRGFPYLLPATSTQWYNDDSQHVRNLSCLNLLGRYYKLPHPITHQYTTRIGPFLNEDDHHALMYVHPERVDYHRLDDEFGKPQYLLTIQNVLEDLPPDLDIPWSTIQHSVFGWNWWTQVISAYRVSRWYPRLVRFMNVFRPSETNEWAVLFEGSASLYRASGSLDAQSICTQCLQELGRRRRQPPFYAFTNGDSRLDITCHVLNGLMWLTHDSYDPPRRRRTR